MGGTVSSGESNDDLVDNLVDHSCIVSERVELVFRSVDRGHYMTPEHRDTAYRDTAWRADNLHLSAPCIYTMALESLDLRPGQRFLNLGSGTGYLSTMAGLLLGRCGVNHGVELHPDVVEYAGERVRAFVQHAPAVDQFDFCEPKFVVGNALQLEPGQQYDRVYCGARCELPQLAYLQQLLAVGGVLVAPVEDSLKRVQRVAEDSWSSEEKLAVSFASLVEPTDAAGDGRGGGVQLPAVQPTSLLQLCRAELRRRVRQCLLDERPDLVPTKPPPRADRRAARRTARRCRVLQLPPDFIDGDEDEEGERLPRSALDGFLLGAVMRMAGDAIAAADRQEFDDGEDEVLDEEYAFAENVDEESSSSVASGDEEPDEDEVVVEDSSSRLQAVPQEADRSPATGSSGDGAEAEEQSPVSAERTGSSGVKRSLDGHAVSESTSPASGRVPRDSGLGDSDGDVSGLAAVPADAAESDDVTGSISSGESADAPLPPPRRRRRMRNADDEDRDGEPAPFVAAACSFSKLMCARVASLPLPHLLRVYVNLDRDLPTDTEPQHLVAAV